MAPTTYGNVALPAITDDALHGSRDGDSYWYEPDVVVLAVKRDDFWRRVTFLHDGDELELDVLDVDMPPLNPCCVSCVHLLHEYLPADSEAPCTVTYDDDWTIERGAPVCADCYQRLDRRARELDREAAADATRAERKDERSYEEWA